MEASLALTVFITFINIAYGRELEIIAVGNEIACGGKQPVVLNGYSHGYITSPGFDQFHFTPPNQNCSWILNANPGMAWKLSFSYYDMGKCPGNILEILDGSEEGGWTRLCGPEHPPNTIITQNEKLVIRFQSDDDAHFTGYRLFFEPSKPKATCPNSHFISCRNDVTCVENVKACDGTSDCEDGTDEQNCPARKPWTICGVPPIRPTLGNDRIVGGREAIPNSWPWQVSMTVSRMNPLGHMCGAALIHPQWLVTAAHCFREHTNKDLWEARLGKHRKLIRDESEQVRYFDQILIHPEYQGNQPRKPKQTWYERKAHDIALVKLNAPVTLTPYVMPVCLPEPEVETKANTVCHVTGWGYTQGTGSDYVLKQASVPVVPRDTCQIMYPYYQIGDNMLCAGHIEGGHDACQGDSGGPLVHIQATRWQLFGVVSTGGTCAAAKEPGIYTQVSKYVNWIRKTVDDH